MKIKVEVNLGRFKQNFLQGECGFISRAVPKPLGRLASKIQNLQQIIQKILSKFLKIPQYMSLKTQILIFSINIYKNSYFHPFAIAVFACDVFICSYEYLCISSFHDKIWKSVKFYLEEN